MTDLRQTAQMALKALESWERVAPDLSLPEYDRAIITLRTALEQQAEPGQWRDMVVVNLIREGVNKHKARELADHFAAPPQRQWVGLTDEDFLEACQIAERGNYLLAFQRIQIKLKERNT